MAEYIDKAVALSIHEPTKSNRHYQTDNLDDAYGQGWDDALCSIEHIPAADVAPVVHGRWRYFHKQNIAVCTECSFERDLDTNFGRAVNCPNCGAKMDIQDGGDNDAAD